LEFSAVWQFKYWRCIYITWFAPSYTSMTKCTAGFATWRNGRDGLFPTLSAKPWLVRLVRVTSISALPPSKESLPYGAIVAISATPART
jgi:hypothetical protein